MYSFIIEMSTSNIEEYRSIDKPNLPFTVSFSLARYVLRNLCAVLEQYKRLWRHCDDWHLGPVHWYVFHYTVIVIQYYKPASLFACNVCVLQALLQM
jgi:hypothetical protein